MLNMPKETWIVFTLVTINSTGWSATMPFFAVYLESRGVAYSVIGLTYLFAGLLLLLGVVLSGRLTDFLGPKRVLLISYLFAFVSSLLLGYLVYTTAEVSWLLILYPLFYLMRSFSQPATSAIIANQKENHMRTGFSLSYVAGNLGFAIGPAIGGILAQFYGYSTVFMLSAFTAVIVTIITIVEVKGGLLSANARPNSELHITEKTVNKWLSWKNDQSLILFLLLVMCSFIAVGYEITPLSVYVAGFLNFSSEQIGYLFATNGLVIVILQIPLTNLTTRMRSLVLPMVLSSIFATTAFLAAAVSTSFLQWEVVMFTVTLAEIFQAVPSQTVVALFSRAGNRGTYQGYYNAFASAGRSLASFFGPVTFGIFVLAPYLSWIAIAAFSVLVGLGFVLLSPHINRDYRNLKAREQADGNF
jgi:MFS family permease